MWRNKPDFTRFKPSVLAKKAGAMSISTRPQHHLCFFCIFELKQFSFLSQAAESHSKIDLRFLPTFAFEKFLFFFVTNVVGEDIFNILAVSYEVNCAEALLSLIRHLTV